MSDYNYKNGTFNISTTGRIYKITCKITNKIYIGSTFKTIEERLRRHKYKFNAYLKGKSKQYCTSYEIIKNNNYIIELIEEHKINRSELVKLEYKYINETTINIVNIRKS